MLHRHEARGEGRYEDCRQVVVIRRSGRPGCLRVVFRAAPGRYVPGGATTASGTVGVVGGAALNLHEPGTARALLDEALARGWRPEGSVAEEADGWALFGAVAARRGAKPEC
ncbi:hypothetical protein SAMN05216223_108192 [Actinacidiphila yanglinensis]|uniref:Uncharacterized protein n=1 Tax=Actinacidiphila yanglinensis TaxID=310779 RepID=A0A1H6C977_9ACTN|nr:hypothetical protein SAMN05216223_108192 [Actinacidiphila yanglinensis]